MKYARRYEWIEWAPDEKVPEQYVNDDQPLRCRIMVNPDGQTIRHEAECLRAFLQNKMTEREYLAECIAPRVVDWNLEIEDPENDGQWVKVKAPGSPSVSEDMKDKQVDALYQLPPAAFTWLCTAIRIAHIPKATTSSPNAAGPTETPIPEQFQAAS
jgi:hypothetical protein